ncbi:hypothetical protein AYI69_g9108, partial [Smittium culicis]
MKRQEAAITDTTNHSDEKPGLYEFSRVLDGNKLTTDEGKSFRKEINPLYA